ncbi:hypothetical protein GQ42DRAFT_162644 [Ramicandelaber brevisporus]|nr:hypothetical protein GQ42DRAFT_162644 [Ramicandelaber brevisporus]
MLFVLVLLMYAGLATCWHLDPYPRGIQYESPSKGDVAPVFTEVYSQQVSEYAFMTNANNDNSSQHNSSSNISCFFAAVGTKTVDGSNKDSMYLIASSKCINGDGKIETNSVTTNSSAQNNTKSTGDRSAMLQSTTTPLPSELVLARVTSGKFEKMNITQYKDGSTVNITSLSTLPLTLYHMQFNSSGQSQPSRVIPQPFSTCNNSLGKLDGDLRNETYVICTEVATGTHYQDDLLLSSSSDGTHTNEALPNEKNSFGLVGIFLGVYGDTYKYNVYLQLAAYQRQIDEAINSNDTKDILLPQDGGLSFGVLIGIIVGCVLSVVVVALIVILIIKRSRKSKQQKLSEMDKRSKVLQAVDVPNPALATTGNGDDNGDDNDNDNDEDFEYEEIDSEEFQRVVELQKLQERQQYITMQLEQHHKQHHQHHQQPNISIAIPQVIATTTQITSASQTDLFVVSPVDTDSPITR